MVAYGLSHRRPPPVQAVSLSSPCPHLLSLLPPLLRTLVFGLGLVMCVHAGGRVLNPPPLSLFPHTIIALLEEFNVGCGAGEDEERRTPTNWLPGLMLTEVVEVMRPALGEIGFPRAPDIAVGARASADSVDLHHWRPDLRSLEPFVFEQSGRQGSSGARAHRRTVAPPDRARPSIYPSPRKSFSRRYK